jgi:hypothetical protein
MTLMVVCDGIVILNYLFANSCLTSLDGSLSEFSALAKYRVVKIARSSCEVVLQTITHTMIYPGSGPSFDIIALRLVI